MFSFAKSVVGRALNERGMSQKTCDEPNTISIHVKPNRELSQQIFSFIPDVEVLSPDWLRQEIKVKIEENLQKYLSVQNGCTNR